jgi:hypothetical protein
MFPFTIRLVDRIRENSDVQPVNVKLDPGAKTTGMSMVRGSYQRTRVDKYGFPRGTLMSQKTVKGFATGDMVKAIVPSGKKQGTYIGRVAVRKTGSFNIQTKEAVVQGISWKYCKIISRQNGYNFASQVSSPA